MNSWCKCVAHVPALVYGGYCCDLSVMPCCAAQRRAVLCCAQAGWVQDIPAQQPFKAYDATAACLAAVHGGGGSGGDDGHGGQQASKASKIAIVSASGMCSRSVVGAVWGGLPVVGTVWGGLQVT